MLVVGLKPGHDGAVAVIKDRKLLFSLESEKDSFPRHAELTATTMLSALELIPEPPDIIAIGGWNKLWGPVGRYLIETGYVGANLIDERRATLFGKPVTRFASSHTRSHIMMGAGMAPPDDSEFRAVLVWEGHEGAFFLLDRGWNLVREIVVLLNPGWRYACLFAIADPSLGDDVILPEGDNAGKLMALAAYSDPADADQRVIAEVDRLLDPELRAVRKGVFSDSPLYNVGVEADITKTAAALLHQRIFDVFADAAVRELPKDIPLYISGGCGLNCDWNTMWRQLGHFSSVFVPPCASDSGSAIGTAIDALHSATGDPRIDWNVYCGLDFDWDSEPDGAKWQSQPMNQALLADALASGRVVAWVQGRWEMGPRALGNRSLLAEPSSPETRDRLNEIKLRETYRPIAPVCRIEDCGKVFDTDFDDPYMLYFRMVTAKNLGAVTHVDGSARAQTVTKESNPPLHDLLSAFAERHGVGVLCNTSLNYKTLGFINSTTDLVHYCETRGVDDFVVGDKWFQRIGPRESFNDHGPVSAPSVRALMERHLPVGATVVVISQGSDEMLDLEGRKGMHFPQNADGSFQGAHPADSDEAIAELEKLRKQGASHLAIPRSDMWWLDQYGGLRDHLANRCRSILSSQSGCAIFELGEPDG